MPSQQRDPARVKTLDDLAATAETLRREAEAMARRLAGLIHQTREERLARENAPQRRGDPDPLGSSAPAAATYPSTIALETTKKDACAP